jgi:hypothetical protein
MTRDEATAILQTFFHSQNVESLGLNENNVGGVVIGDLQLYFEYKIDGGALNCSALIYSFHNSPQEGVLAGFKQEETVTDTGGGLLDYQQENKGLYLSRSYTKPVTNTQFIKDMERLLAASRVWSNEVLERVAARVFSN